MSFFGGILQFIKNIGPVEDSMSVSKVINNWEHFPYTLHRNSPEHLKPYNIKISSRLQQFSGGTSELSREKL